VQAPLSNDTRAVAGADGPDTVCVVDQDVSGDFFADFQYVGRLRHWCTDRMFGAGAEWGRRPAPILIPDARLAVCTENLIQVDDVMESPELAE
jgi:hypothetical protein